MQEINRKIAPFITNIGTNIARYRFCLYFNSIVYNPLFGQTSFILFFLLMALYNSMDHILYTVVEFF